jgi:hypothetical protein
MNVKANLRKATSKDAFVQLGWAAGGAVIYAALPTAFKMSGWGALLVAILATWGVGAIFGLPGMQTAAVGMGVMHLFYTHGQDVSQKAFNSPIWRFDTTAPIPTSNGVSDGQYVQLPMRGEVAYAQRPTELPAPQQLVQGGMQDYVAPIGAYPGVSDYLYPTGGGGMRDDVRAAPAVMPHAAYPAGSASLPL